MFEPDQIKPTFYSVLFTGEPELLGFSQCLTNTMCDYPQVPAVYGHNSFSVPVRYKGPGPFTVTWHRPNGEVNCNGKLSNHCQIATNDTTNESVSNRK